ncbi:MAG: NADAR family protein, partial [candidate division NC10 bacterium]
MIRTCQGPDRFRSNCWPAAVVLDGVDSPTVEHASQAAKTLNPALRVRIREASTPGEAKRLGRAIARRLEWDTVRRA